MTALLVVAFFVALVVIAWLLVYRARHPHTRDDLEKARHDSVARSRSVVSGKVQEHLVPLFPEFLRQFNPRDARFLGTPLDFVVFDGLDEGDVRRVVFVEVKTGRSALASRERLCRDAIEAGRVEFQLLRLSGDTIQAANGEVAEAEAPPALHP
jgi:predicted Holliday junction resolvase-like endonuclease